MNPLIKRAIITAGLETVAFSGMSRFMPKAAGRGLIFTLHHVRPATNLAYDSNALLSITPDFLDATIRECLAQNYKPVRLEDLPRLLATEMSDERYVVFTLDDGCRDNAVHAAPVFRKHNVPYTLFITKGLVERTHTMWWETAEALTRAVERFDFDFGSGSQTIDCSTLAKKHAASLRLAPFIESMDEDVAVARLNEAALANGVNAVSIVNTEILDAKELSVLAEDPLASFGAHTVSHCCMTRIDETRLDYEIVESIKAIEGWTGKTPVSIAYPYGWKRACGKREGDAARKAGLRIGLTTQPGMLKPSFSQDEWMLLPRVSLNGYYQKRRYVSALLSGIPFKLMGG